VATAAWQKKISEGDIEEMAEESSGERKGRRYQAK